MENNEKTTVYLNAAQHRRLKALAAAQGRPAAELIREAVAEYVSSRTSQAGPSSIGAGRSGRGDLSARTDELLEGFGEAD